MEDPNIITSGYLPVGDGHKLYFEEWGNPEGTPIFYLHGGPGDGFSDSNKFLFDPQKHHVIFHDQRGSGKSTPYASTDQNTTQKLIGDITTLADHLHIDSFILIGGSWGSTLALLYAIAHPERVQQMILWGIFLVRQFEFDYFSEGYAQYTFPEAWERFSSLVPQEKRKTGNSIVQYYAKQIRSKDEAIAKKFVSELVLWEATLISRNYDQRRVEASVFSEDHFAIAMLETHYFLNNYFVPENYILENIKTIQDIPSSIIHGRFDMCTPPIVARDLAKAYGKNATLQWTNGGHLRSEPENFAAIKATINAICGVGL